MLLRSASAFLSRAPLSSFAARQGAKASLARFMSVVTDKDAVDPATGKAFVPSNVPRKDWMVDPTPAVPVKTQPKQDLSGLLGKHIIYTYANGWHYEFYFRNENTADYRIASGMVAGRWTTNQYVHYAALGHDIYKVVWNEPTGTTCALEVCPSERWLHGLIDFPQWIAQKPEQTVDRDGQFNHFDEMNERRDTGPCYPRFFDFNFAEITYMEDAGLNNDDVINCSYLDLPEGYLDRKN